MMNELNKILDTCIYDLIIHTLKDGRHRLAANLEEIFHTGRGIDVDPNWTLRHCIEQTIDRANYE